MSRYILNAALALMMIVCCIATACAQESSTSMTNRNFEDDGHEYTLEYILGNYNAFVWGDYDNGNHVSGPIIVGGKVGGLLVLAD